MVERDKPVLGEIIELILTTYMERLPTVSQIQVQFLKLCVIYSCKQHCSWK